MRTDTDSRKSWFSPILRLCALFVGLSICIFILSDNIDSYDELISSHANANWGFTLFVIISFSAHTILVFYAWHYSLKLLGISVPVNQSGAIFISSLLTRYLPGGIWHIGSRFFAMARMGANPVKVSISLFLEQAAAVVICIMMTLLFFSVSDAGIKQLSKILTGTPSSTILLLAVLTVIVVLMLVPSVFNFLINYLFRIIKQQTVNLRLRTSSLVAFYSIHILSLLFFVGGYYFSTLIYADSSDIPVFLYAAVILLATFIGYITPLVPGGIGIREAVLAAMFASIIEGPELVGIVLLPRIILIITEFLLFAVILIFYQSDAYERRAN